MRRHPVARREANVPSSSVPRQLRDNFKEKIAPLLRITGSLSSDRAIIEMFVSYSSVVCCLFETWGSLWGYTDVHFTIIIRIDSVSQIHIIITHLVSSVSSLIRWHKSSGFLAFEGDPRNIVLTSANRDHYWRSKGSQHWHQKPKITATKPNFIIFI